MPRIDCQGVLFDLDGVLVDSRPVIRRHWTRWSEQQGLDIERVLEIAHGRRPVDTVRLLLPDADDPDALAESIVAGEASDAQGLVTLPGVQALLENLAGGRWTVATSGPRPIAEFRLRFAGVPILPTMVTAEDVRQGKPHPEPYQRAAEKLQVAPQECIVIEDAPAGVAAGRAAGARVIALTTTHPADELREAGATWITENLSRLRAQVSPGGERIELAILAGDG